jgi:hypothetical protein
MAIQAAHLESLIGLVLRYILRSVEYSNFNLCQVPPVMCPDDGCFPGLYCSSMLSDPWLSNHCTIILTSAWRSIQVILLVDVLR